MDELGAVPAAPAEEVSSGTQPEIEAPEAEKPEKDLLDRTWDFFASVPVATTLIFIIAVASVAGTLIQQENTIPTWPPAEEFYAERYGPVMSTFLMKTGMTNMYGSWWYLTLLFMLGASLVICSLERFIPLWRAVQRPNPTPDPSFVKHLKNRFEYRPQQKESPLAELAAALRARRYLVIEKDGRLYADKGRWGRWGPYITHIGLIMILLGAMMRAIPGAYFDQFIWVRDGEIVKVPNTDFFVQSEKFTVEFYESGQPKSYQTDALILDNDGTVLAKQKIIMNEPLMYNWVELYQSSYRQELGTATVALTDRASGSEIGRFDLDLIQPKPLYEVAGHKIRVVEYFTDFGLDEKGKPVSRSSQVNNPGLVAEITTPDGKVYTNWYFVMYPEMEFDPKVPVRFTTADMKVASTTGLMVKKDLGVPVIYLGLLVITLGVCFTFYMAHRRYWALPDGNRVIVGGWTNRNHGTLAHEMTQLAHQLDPKANPITDALEGEER
ncbi:MAG: cytochrome c biogenesis protein ResB [Bacillota bacterium]